jgi:uncharacterized pyridoxamine 5'-phosphate oxidase family protein
MNETSEEIERLQQPLDQSANQAGAHLRAIISDDRRLKAKQVCQFYRGMRLLVVAGGRPLVGPVDGYLLHGSFYFSSARNSVRMRHLAARPAISLTHLAGEELAITVPGRVDLFDVLSDEHPGLRQAMLNYYLVKQGPAFETWLNDEKPVGARVTAEKMFTFRLSE